jgi:hypothetical protein
MWEIVFPIAITLELDLFMVNCLFVSGAQNCKYRIWYMSSLLAATASGSSKQA